MLMRLAGTDLQCGESVAPTAPQRVKELFDFAPQITGNMISLHRLVLLPMQLCIQIERCRIQSRRLSKA